MDDLADLYGILKTMERLEKAYVRDLIPPEEYTTACQNLISQFKTTERALLRDRLIESVDAFITAYEVDAPLARERLLVIGVPATIYHGGGMASNSNKDSSSSAGGSGGNAAATIAADATSLFITTSDAVKLNQRAVDQIQPLIQDLVRALNRAEVLVPGFEREPLQKWLVLLNSMRAVEELDDDQVRQLSFDLDSSFNNFMKRLKGERD